MKLIHCDQGDTIWMANRCGMITASRIIDVLSVLKKGGESAARRDYRWELVAERLTHDTEDHYVSPDMEEGRRREEESRVAYGMANGVLVEEVGLVIHPTMDFYRCSPDGLIGNDGGLELKNPKVTTHLKWRDAGVVPPEHEPQCMAGIDCCEREWWDFVSYVPALAEDLQLFQVRLYRDEKRISEIQAEVRKFESEINMTIEHLYGKTGAESLTEQLRASLEVV